ncbi:hypothetical protein [Pseudomonas sp. LB1P83]
MERHPGGEKQDDKWFQTLELYDAYLTVTGFDSTTPCLDDFIALRGFMNAEMELSEEANKDIASQLCEIFIRANVLSETEASLILDEAQLKCNEKYLAREPSKPELLIYQSLFSTKEPGCPAYVDFASLGSALSDSSLQFLSSLLSKYLASLTCEQAATDAGLIIGLAQGLLYQNPGLDFGDIHLPATSSTEFISVARARAEWQMHGAGFFREDVAENWKYVSTVILNFFVANNVLHLDKAGRRLLTPN